MTVCNLSELEWTTLDETSEVGLSLKIMLCGRSLGKSTRSPRRSGNHSLRGKNGLSMSLTHSGGIGAFSGLLLSRRMEGGHTGVCSTSPVAWHPSPMLRYQELVNKTEGDDGFWKSRRGLE